MIATIEVLLSGASIGIRSTDGEGLVGQWEYYPISTIKSVTGVFNEDSGLIDSSTMQRKSRYYFTDMLRVRITQVNPDQTDILFDIQQVSNQPTWTSDESGLSKAIEDINGWITSVSPGTSPGSLISGTPVFVRTTGFHQIPEGAFNISVANLGVGDAVLDSTTLPSGLTFSFEASTEVEIDVNGTGSEDLFIKYMV